jgi:hypothetical protein
MAYTPAEYTGDGVTTEFTFSFPYLDKEEVIPFLDEEVSIIITDFTVSGQTVTFLSAPATDVAISIQRSTEIDDAKAVFQDPFTISTNDLNLDVNQLLYLAQELASGLDRVDVDIEGIKLELGGVGGDYQIGDAVETTRDLDSNPSFLREKLNFDRVEYATFDAQLGVYAPATKDFANYASLDIFLPKAQTNGAHPSTGSLKDNDNVNMRETGIFGNYFFVLRNDELTFINKSDMTLAFTLVPTVGTRWITGNSVSGKFLIYVETIGIQTSAHIAEVNSDFLDFTIVHTITNLNSNHAQFMWYESTILDTDENYFYLTLAPYGISYDAQGLISVIRILKDYSESANTLFKHDASIAATDIQAKAYYPYYHKKDKELKSFHTVNSGTVGKSPIYTSLPDALMNKNNGTSIDVNLPLNNTPRLASFPRELLRPETTGLNVYGTIYTPRFVINEEKNEVVVTGIFNEVSASEVSEFAYINYDLTSGKVKSSIRQDELAEFLDVTEPFFTNIFSSGAGQIFTRHYIISESIDINIGSKTYQPFIWNTLNNQGIVFINNDNGIDIIKNRPHSVSAGLGQAYLESNHKIVSDEQNIIYFCDGRGDSSDSSRTIRKLSMNDDIATSPFRPAPELNSILPVKGYFKGK